MEEPGGGGIKGEVGQVTPPSQLRRGDVLLVIPDLCEGPGKGLPPDNGCAATSFWHVPGKELQVAGGRAN